MGHGDKGKALANHGPRFLKVQPMTKKKSRAHVPMLFVVFLFLIFKFYFMVTNIKFSIAAKSFKEFLSPIYTLMNRDHSSVLFLFTLETGFFCASDGNKVGVLGGRKTPVKLVISGKQVLGLRSAIEHLDVELLELTFLRNKFYSLTIIF